MMWDSASGPIAAVFCVFLISQSSCHYPDLSGGMTGNNSFTLCCTKTGGWGFTDLFSVFWYRNGTFVFKTYRLYGTYIDGSSFQNPVKLRLTWRRHCVDVSKVEAGISVWRCNDDNDRNTWSRSIHLSGFTAGETPFELPTDTPVRGNVTLNVYPEKIFDDTNFTLSCTVETLMQINISEMMWLQNQTEFIVTFSNRSHIILDNSNSPVVIETTQSDNQHNLTLEADLDARNGTAWTCAIPVLSVISNTVLVHVLEPIDDISESDTFLMPSADENGKSSKTTTPLTITTPTTKEYVTNVQTTVSMAVLSTENTRTPKPSQDSTLFIVTGVLLTALMLLIVTISTVIVCRKNTQGPRSASATAETVPQEQEAGLCINPVYVASHAMEGPLGSTALADSRARLEGDGNRHPDGRGDYDVPEMNVPQPSNIYEQLKVYKEI